jgi:hypothetical protein
MSRELTTAELSQSKELEKENEKLIDEKIKKLKNELLFNSKWDIHYEDGTYYIKSWYMESYPINVELREMLPNSFFYSPEGDEEIVGYDAFTGSIIYNLWNLGKKEMEISEDIISDFHDTGYGIGKILKSCEVGYEGKVPPTHILTPDFIWYQNRLQGSLKEWGDDVEFVKPYISEIEQRRFDMREHINFYVNLMEKWTDIPDDSRNIYQKILDDLRKEYESLK